LNLIKDIVISEVQVHSKGVTDLFEISRATMGSDFFERIFFLVSSASDKRGAHAHKACTQWFVILNGSATLFVTDGYVTQNIDISTIGTVVKIPPRIWVEVHIIEPSTIAVLTDQVYDEADYIRDWDTYAVQQGVL
jgi:hypothetical protein